MGSGLRTAQPAREMAYHQPYTSSQAAQPPYHPSYYAYDPYQRYSNPHHQISYYPDHYSIACIQQQQQQQDPTSIHPPGVPIPPPTVHMVGSGQTHVQNHPNSCFPQGFVAQEHHHHYHHHHQQQHHLGIQEQQWGMNNSGLGQVPVYGGPGFMHPPIRQFSYEGGSKGGIPFRGDHGHSSLGGPSGCHVSGENFSMPQRHAALTLSPLAWCEICRVDCNSLKILEQHKSGKKHKKNLQRFEELQRFEKLQNLKKAIVEEPELQMPQKANAESVHPRKVDAPEVCQAAEDSMPSEAVTDNNIVETDQKNYVDQSVLGPTIGSERYLRSENTNGIMPTETGGRGGKRVRTNELPRRSAASAKQKVIVSLTCDLCNITCDSEVVFESHLAGKKHFSKLRRSLGPGGYQATEHGMPPEAVIDNNQRVETKQQKSVKKSVLESAIEADIHAGLENSNVQGCVESHLTGKKHFSKLRRSLGPRGYQATEHGMPPEAVIDNQRVETKQQKSVEKSVLEPEIEADVYARLENSNAQATEHGMPLEAVIDNQRVENKQHKSVEKSVLEPTIEADIYARLENSNAQGCGIKRSKTRGGGSTRAKTNEIPKQLAFCTSDEIDFSLICVLCNFRCDSEVVFESHLAGKKHLSNLNRADDHQATAEIERSFDHPPIPGLGLLPLYSENFNFSSTIASGVSPHSLPAPEIHLDYQSDQCLSSS